MPYAQEKIMPYGDGTPKGEQVERMFDSIAHSYDLLNHFLSFGIDRSWRRKAIDSLKDLPHQKMLDIATGTGDFAILAQQRLMPEHIVASDLSEGMMQIGKEKVRKKGLEGTIEFRKEDCMSLTFPANTFDAITVAYGVRNFQDLNLGLKEMLRVLKPGGHAVILELCTPNKIPMRWLFWIYAHVVMPLVGKMVSKDKNAYGYLPATMEAFPQGEVMQNILQQVGYSEVSFQRFTFGLSTMYLAKK